MFKETILKKLYKLPEDTSGELDQIRNDMKNIGVGDGTITEAKLHISLKDKIKLIGNILLLKTTTKTDLVAAINEVFDKSSKNASDLSRTNQTLGTLNTTVTTVSGKANKNETDIVNLNNRVNGFRNYNITSGTANPTGGSHGDIYFKYK